MATAIEYHENEINPNSEKQKSLPTATGTTGYLQNGSTPALLRRATTARSNSIRNRTLSTVAADGTFGQEQSQAVPSQASLWGLSLRETTDVFFQTIALIVALIFGAWAIKTYNAQLDSNTVGLLSSQLSLRAYCKSGQISEDELRVCQAVVAALPLASLSSAFSVPTPVRGASTPALSIAPIPTTTTAAIIPSGNPSAPSSATAIATAPLSGFPGSSSSALSLGAIVGIIIGAVAVFAVMVSVGWLIWRRRRVLAVVRSMQDEEMRQAAEHNEERRKEGVREEAVRGGGGGGEDLTIR